MPASCLHRAARVQTESWFPTFKAALPVAGADPVRWTGGTLASRMRDTRATNNLRAKNGGVTGVTSLAGYVTGAGGRPYVFAMISSYSRSSPRPVEDRLVVLLAGWAVSELMTSVRADVMSRAEQSSAHTRLVASGAG